MKHGFWEWLNRLSSVITVGQILSGATTAVVAAITVSVLFGETTTSILTSLGHGFSGLKSIATISVRLPLFSIAALILLLVYFSRIGRHLPVNNLTPLPGAITVDDVIDAARESNLLSKQMIWKYSARRAWRALMQRGVVTKSQLDSVFSSKEIEDILRKLYLAENRISKEDSLDIMAISTFGALLYQFGPNNQNVQSHIRAQLRRGVVGRYHSLRARISLLLGSEATSSTTRIRFR